MRWSTTSANPSKKLQKRETTGKYLAPGLPANTCYADSDETIQGWGTWHSGLKDMADQHLLTLQTDPRCKHYVVGVHGASQQADGKA